MGLYESYVCQRLKSSCFKKRKKVLSEFVIMKYKQITAADAVRIHFCLQFNLEYIVKHSTAPQVVRNSRGSTSGLNFLWMRESAVDLSCHCNLFIYQYTTLLKTSRFLKAWEPKC